MARGISNAVIRRMPRYYRYLEDLIDSGVERISSSELSERMHVTASQIRQDLNNFGGFGQQGYGYNVKYLYDEIGKILGLDKRHKLIIIGAGHMGHALASYAKFGDFGFSTVALFDKDPDKIGEVINGAPVLPIEQLSDYIRDHNVDMAALTVPKEKAAGMADLVVRAGVKAIWNFANVDLKFEDKSVSVENVHLTDSLMRLSYSVISKEKTKE